MYKWNEYAKWEYLKGVEKCSRRDNLNVSTNIFEKLKRPVSWKLRKDVFPLLQNYVIQITDKTVAKKGAVNLL